MKNVRKSDFQDKLVVANQTYTFYSLVKLAETYQTTIENLPYTIRILLESVVRQADGEDVTNEHWERLLAFGDPKLGHGDVPFKPSRVVLQDFTGVPAIVDLAAMREAVLELGGQADDINPAIPVDLVVDHSVQVDHAGTPQALAQNVALEFERNKERYQFLKWAQQAFDHYRVVPPATGIIHQVNIEYLSDVVLAEASEEAPHPVLFPDSLVGTDSHTTMINGLGVLGWGVGGIEAEASMLGEPSYFPLPEVIGVRLIGKLSVGATATDLALRVTECLRQEQVVGKFVEFFGPGYTTLSLADRATIANMAPEYGATCGFFPVDEETLRYLDLTGRDPDKIARTKAYLQANQLFYQPEKEATYTKVIELDLATIETNLSGPKRPQDVIPLSEMKEKFQSSLTAPAGNQGFGLAPEEAQKVVHFDFQQTPSTLKTGDVTIAAITSCTNTSNPAVMLAAGLLARNAVAKGLRVSPLVKTSLAPGSQVVTAYLEDAGLLEPLEALGFAVVGYGCTTCIGNSGPLDAEVSAAIQAEDLVVGAVLSGNRNFEGRIHPLVKANFLASPPLVVAYALAGNVGLDLKKDPLGYNAEGQAIYLADVWPERAEIDAYIEKYVTPDLYREYYAQVFDANDQWNQIAAPETHTYEWQAESTYIAKPPFFENMTREPLKEHQPLKGLRVLAKFGDSVTTDHISPAGTIGMRSPAGTYLQAHGVKPRNFNSFGSRRGHHEVMMRGTFGNIRIRNQIAQGTEGGVTTYWPTGEILSIYEAAMQYQADETGLVILTGDDYGMGSSRDWAAKGTRLLGVKAVIAKSYERIHRSNLVMMGVLPLQFQVGEDADRLGLSGSETFAIQLPEEIGIRQKVKVVATAENGTVTNFTTIARFDAQADLRYYAHQGILPMVIRKKVAQSAGQ